MTSILFRQGDQRVGPLEWPTVPRVGEHVAVMDEGVRLSGDVKRVMWKPDGSVTVSLVPLSGGDQ